MSGSRPGESNGVATSSILPVAGQLKPLPDYAISLVRDYDIQGVTAMLSSLAHCSFEVQMEAFSKVRSIASLTCLASVSFGFQALVYPI